MNTEYKIIMEYITHEEYEIIFDEDGDHICGNIWDNYEEPEPNYIVKEVLIKEDGKYEELDSLEVFKTYKEAVEFVEEMKRRDENNVL